MNFQIKDIIQDIKTGARKADVVQQNVQKLGESYGQSVFDPRFKKGVAAAGVTLKETPAQFLGAYASRMVVDAANDGTRLFYWRHNNPFGLGQDVAQKGTENISSPTARALATLAVTIPATAAAGTYNITNISEQFRPKGYAQTYSEQGSEDRRETGQPIPELIDRFFLGRQGQPLKYETAKQDIPSLTPQRYGNYQNFLYNEKGLLGLGLLKATSENLQGYPEARLVGFPITIPMVGGYTAGTIAAAKAVSAPGTSRQRAVRGVIGGLTGSIAGVAVGNLVNEVIATANRPQLEELENYQQGM